MAVSPLGWHVTGLPGAHELAAQGCSARQIARALNLSELTVKRWAWRNRVELPKYVRDVKPDHARMIELAEAGMTTTEIANELDYCYATVRRALRAFGVTPARKSQAKGLREVERAEKMASMFRQGLTLQNIGEHFGVTRERVRQILQVLDIKPEDGGSHKVATLRRARISQTKEAKSIANYGLGVAEVAECRKNGLLYSFKNQRNAAKVRGIEWSLTLGEWLTVWQESGKLAQRGRGKGKYVMSRIRDEGGYRVGNVHIQLSTDNNSQGIAKCRHNKAKTPGVWLMYPGLAKPWMARHGRVTLGLFATEAEGAEAKRQYLAARAAALDLKAA